MIIKNAQIFLDESGMFESFDIEIEEGRIAAIGKNLNGKDGMNACGCYVTPGLIEAHSHIGMCEEGIQWEGDDICENEPVTPEMRSVDAIFPYDSAFREALFGGVTTICTGFGSGGVVAGTAAIIENNGAGVVDKMVLVPDSAMKCAFGENPRNFGRKGKQPNTRASVAFMLRKCLEDAIDYAAQKAEREKKQEHFTKSLGMEQMLRVINREIPIKAHVHRSDDICTAIRIAKEYDILMTLDHCTDGHLIAAYIAESGFPAIVGPSFGSKSKYELRNKSFMTVPVLIQAGVKVCITTDHNVTPQESLIMLAAMCVKAGLSQSDALRCVTSNAADILGIQDRKGRLKEGLDADIVIWNMHPLDMQAKPTHVFVRGREMLSTLTKNSL